VGSKLIAYECVASAHQASPKNPDKLTIYNGRWAFCAFGALADDHEWRDTGGADFGSLMRKVGLAVVAAGNEIDSGAPVATK
jgi:hypothetical protein